VTPTWWIIVASSEAGLVSNRHYPSCQQCDNPTWSHTAFLSQFHVRCRSPFQLHNRHGGGALRRACNLTSFSPCLTGPVDYPFASCHEGPGFKSPGGYLCGTGILLLALSRYNPLLLDSTTTRTFSVFVLLAMSLAEQLLITQRYCKNRDSSITLLYLPWCHIMWYIANQDCHETSLSHNIT
jgi:hypothetical protein